MITQLQKDIVIELFKGGSIAAYGKFYRLGDKKHSPVRTFYFNIWFRVKHILRKSGGMYVLDKNKVRKLHGKNWIKKYYKQQNQNHLL